MNTVMMKRQDLPFYQISVKENTSGQIQKDRYGLFFFKQCRQCIQVWFVDIADVSKKEKKKSTYLYPTLLLNHSLFSEKGDQV